METPTSGKEWDGGHWAIDDRFSVHFKIWDAGILVISPQGRATGAALDRTADHVRRLARERLACPFAVILDSARLTGGFPGILHRFVQRLDAINGFNGLVVLNASPFRAWLARLAWRSGWMGRNLMMTADPGQAERAARSLIAGPGAGPSEFRDPDPLTLDSCPITGASIHRQEAWADVRLGAGFSASFRRIGRDICWTAFHGDSGSCRVGTYLRRRARVLDGMFEPEDRFVEIRDYSHMTGGFFRGVFCAFFESLMLDEPRCLGVIGCQAPKAVRLGLMLYRWFGTGSTPYRLAPDYRAAVMLAGTMRNARRGFERLPFPEIRFEPEWRIADGEYWNHYGVVGNDVLLSITRGQFLERNVLAALDLQEHILETVFGAGRAYYLVLDLSAVESPDRRGRAAYIQGILRLHRTYPIRLVVACGLGPLLAAAVRVARYQVPFPVVMARDVAEAWERIAEDRFQRGPGLRDPLEPATETGEADRLGKGMEELERFISGIDWTSSSTPDLTTAMVAPGHPLGRLFNVIALIKNDLDDLSREHRATLAALRENEERYRQLVATAPAGIFEVDFSTGRFTQVNDLMVAFTGYPRPELMALDPFSLLEESSRERMTERLARMTTGQETEDSFELEIISRSGRRSWVSVQIRLAHEGDRLQGFTAVATDITERKRMEEALTRHNRDLSLLNHAAQAFNATLDLDRVLDIVMETLEAWTPLHGAALWLLDEADRRPICRRMLGASRPDDLAMGLEEPGPLIRRAMAEARAIMVDDTRGEGAGESGTDDTEVRSRVAVPLLAGSRPLGVLEATSREPGFFNSTHLDLLAPLASSAAMAIDNIRHYWKAQAEVADRTKAERALRLSQDKYNTVLEQMEDGYWETDLNGNITLVNMAMAALLPGREPDLIGRPLSAFLSPEEGARLDRAMDEVATGNPTPDPLSWVIRKDDTHARYIEATIFPILNQQGSGTGFRGIARDVTQRVLTESLRQAKAAAEDASRSKSEFLANMSHEIRTPLHGIIGMIELAMDTRLDENQQYIMETVASEASSLLSLINDILDFSKIEAERLDLESVPFDLRYLLEDVVSGVSLGAEQKGLEFISYMAPDVPSRVVGDPGRLRQILVNLAGNALKFTHQGEIFIRCERVEDRADKVRVRFTIKDTGIGIPKGKQAAIFDIFTQADSSTTRRYGGTGLGTTIARQLVQLMDGEIGLDSEVGMGSTFWFTVVLHKQAPSARRALEADLEGRRILVVDDNETNRRILMEYLQSWGCSAEPSATGEQALDRLTEAAAAGEPFDLLLTDIRMPGMDGFELALKARQDEHLARLPIIVLTSIGRIGDGRRCREIGIEGYLTKPIRRDDLRRAVASVLGLSQAPADTPEPLLITRHFLAEAERREVRVLLAEDYPTNQQVAMRHLKGAGYQVDLARNGAEAVDAFRQHTYDMILMDIQMPDMDGYSATRAIRRLERETEPNDKGADRRRTPIVAMTANALKGDRENSLEAGMDDYITKPLRRRQLIEIVEKWVSDSRRDPNGAPSDFPPEPGDTGDGPDMVDMDSPMDYTRAIEEFEGDEAFMREVAEGFLERVTEQVSLMRQALADGDMEALCREAHAIKGGSANLTADDLSGAASDLEAAAKAGQPEAAGSALNRLESEFVMLKSFLAGQ